MYIYLDNDMSFIPALRSVSSSTGVSSAKVCRWSRVRDLIAIFFYWNKTDCWLLYAYVLVYASMYWYITVITLRNSIKRVCSSMQQYVLVHTSTYYQWYSLFQYVPVHTCTYMYILVHTSYWIRKIDGAMTWYKGVHPAIPHIMERHDIVWTALNILVLTCPGV